MVNCKCQVGMYQEVFSEARELLLLQKNPDVPSTLQSTIIRMFS